MICKVCGFHNEAGAEFCGQCGTFLEWSSEAAGDDPAPADATTADAVPGSTSTVAPPTSSATAKTSGGSTTAAATGASSTATPDSSAATERQAPEIIGPPCPVCGKPVPRDRTFCPHCGADTRAPHAGAKVAVVEPPPPKVRRLPSIGMGIGPIILVGAFVVVALAAILILPRFLGGAALPSGEARLASASPTATAKPSPSPAPSESVPPSEPPPSDSPPPEPSPTPVVLTDPPTGAAAKAAIVSFLKDFDAAYRAGDAGFLLDHLDPAVIRAYSTSACRSSIKSFAQPDFRTKVKSVSGPAAYTYMPTNGKNSLVDATYVIKADRTRAGTTKPLTMHLSFDKGTFFWFANAC